LENVGSPGEIRTPVGGSKAQMGQNCASFTIRDINWAVSDFWQHCKIEERLSDKVCKDYRNVTHRFLLSCNGVVSRQSIRQFLEPYLHKAPKTYNNIIDGLRAFIERYLQKQELIDGFKHTHVSDNFDRQLPTKEQLKKGFEALETDKERAIYLFYVTTGLRRSEALNLNKTDVDLETRCAKSKHDTRTKRAGVSFYNSECETYLKNYLNSRKDDNNRLFRIGYRESLQIWKKASRAAEFKITPQVLRKWNSTELGEQMVPDRFVDVFQGRAPRSVLAKHYTGKGLERLKRIYDKADLEVIT
jgi:integrase